ncbi:restriction endonuclease subunit S [Micromonospora sp. ATA51]|uniref:restriction endonuclease subunit S n=1 Tax=Micromonospora sp. ATA51 TaxID=2806098 RepID=UPI001A516A7D|nr:restriction endonuclease subunit S [Micromonospora sp. ATA51]MBM0227020.1 restriction endonuclease subunit S [Micromonospora sp. ATA51]
MGRIDLGRQRHPNWHAGPEMRPYLRVANVFEDRIDTSDLKEMDFSDVYERYKLEPGDVLLNEGQSPELLGRPAIYRGVPENVAFTNTLLRFRAGPDVLPEWALAVFRRHMHSRRFAREARITTNIAHLSASRLKSVEFPVPPIMEQQRIVQVLDHHLSRLAAAQFEVDSAARRVDGWRRASIDRLLSNLDASVRSVAELLREPMRNGHSARAARDGEPGIRTLTLTAVTRCSFSEAYTKMSAAEPRRVEALWLTPGDILVQRSNTPELVGTAAMFDGPPNWAIFPDLMIRLRVDTDAALPEYVTAVLRSERVHRHLRSKARGLAGSMPKIDQQAIASILLKIPPLARQRELVSELSEIEQTYSRLARAANTARRQGQTLRKALLEAAFSGRLTGRASDIDMVEEMAGV